MGTPINTPLTSEIWHLTIDDLLAPVPAAPSLGGPGPFVINLSASTAPISLPMKAVADHPGAHLYQIQRTEDRRVRYRLRFGPFETEAQAEALLPVVREIYPSALTASAEPEDLRAIESIKTKIEAQQLAAVKAAVSKAAAAPLPNAPRSGAARAVPREPPESPPEPPPAAATADGGALPTTPPPAWLALRTPSAAAEIVRTVAARRPAPVFAPARFSASAKAFVPNTDFVTASELRSASTVRKAPAPAPAPVSPTPRPVAAAVPAAPVTPEAAPAPVPAMPPESLIPVLSDSMAVVRPAAPPMPAAAPPMPAAAPPTPAAAPPISAAAAPAAPARVPAAAAPVPAATPTVTPTPAPALTRMAAAAAVSLQSSPHSAARVPRMVSAPRTPAAPAAAPTPIHHPIAKPAENKLGQPPRRIEALSTPLSSFDTTQTLRPLTPTELEDASALRWFVIQLSCAEEAFDPDALPNLDIFSEYRLYSVAGFDQGKLMHTLRLGFFSEESHAKAVAGYLGSFYENPAVKRVSAAERTRFAQHRVEARKDIGATGKHTIIEITDERVIRPKRPLPTPPPARGR